MKNKSTVVLFIITFLMFFNYVSSQVPESLFGVADNFFLSVGIDPVNTEMISELQSFEDETVRTLAFIPSECKYYGIINHSVEPTLIWFDYEGNSGTIGQLNLAGFPIPMCEALAYNPLDGLLYAGISLDGNPDNNDFHSETIVSIDFSSAGCTYISETNGDIDAMEFAGEYLIISDTENGAVVISSLLFQNLPNEITLNPILELNEDIYIVDLASTSSSGIIHCTTGHDLYSLDISVVPAVLQWLGITHDEFEYNGERMYGLTTAILLAEGFHFEPFENLVEFTPVQSFNEGLSFSWDFGDGSFSNEYNPTHTYSESGNYEVCLTVTFQGCSFTKCENILISPLSVSNNADLNSFLKTTPNPADQHVLIELTAEPESINTIEVYDLSGRLLLKKSEIIPSNYMLEIGNLSSGEYIVIVNRKYLGKVIKS